MYGPYYLPTYLYDIHLNRFFCHHSIIPLFLLYLFIFIFNSLSLPITTTTTTLPPPPNLPKPLLLYSLLYFIFTL